MTDRSPAPNGLTVRLFPWLKVMVAAVAGLLAIGGVLWQVNQNTRTLAGVSTTLLESTAGLTREITDLSRTLIAADHSLALVVSELEARVGVHEVQFGHEGMMRRAERTDALIADFAQRLSRIEEGIAATNRGRDRLEDQIQRLHDLIETRGIRGMGGIDEEPGDGGYKSGWAWPHLSDAGDP